MTLPPEKLGDRGQQYVLESKGYPFPDWGHVSYSNALPSLIESSEALHTHPTCLGTRIIDRHDENKIVFQCPANVSEPGVSSNPIA